MLRVFRPLLVTRERREVLLALTSAYMLVQLSSLPVALTLPTLGEVFGVSISDAAWVVVMYLLVLGGFVLLAARLGDRYGHARVFFLGILASTIGSGLIALSQDLWQVVMWRGIAGLGSAMILGNSNAILAATFPPEERGRAFAVPIMGSRFGTLTGLAGFGLFLQFLSWQFIFISFIPLGVLAMAACLPMLRHAPPPPAAGSTGSIDWLGGVLLVATAMVLIASGNHLHGGEDTFVSSDGLTYHLPMHAVFVALLIVFVLVERRVTNPIVDMKHFRQNQFSMALASNVTYHFSMLATMTLIPIVVEEGFGMSPLWVTVVLVPSQSLGIFMPMVAGWVFDRYQPRLLRPRHDGPHCWGLPDGGHASAPDALLDPASAHAAHRRGNQHVQPHQQRHHNERASIGAPRCGLGDAGNHSRVGPCSGCHGGRGGAGPSPARLRRGPVWGLRPVLLPDRIPRVEPDGSAGVVGRG